MSSTRRFSLYGGAVSVLRFNPTAAHALPHPDETWTRGDVPDVVTDCHIKLERHDIIEIVQPRRHRDDYRNLYRTNRRAYEYIQSNIEAPRTLPCGHAGVRNLVGGEFACTNDACDDEFDRETAAEVLRA